MTYFKIVEPIQLWTTKEKRAIAKRYADRHRNTYKPNYGLISIFDNLINGVFGEVREEIDGDYIIYKIEIGRFECISGNSEIFEFTSKIN